MTTTRFSRPVSKPLLTKVAASVALTLAMAQSASAANLFSGENWDVNLDTTFSVGASWRVEDIDEDLIGKSNLPEFYDPAFGMGSGRVPPGSWSTNGDDGDLNFKKGETFSKVFKITPELDIRHRDGYGMFVRATGFYDFELMDEDRPCLKANPTSCSQLSEDALEEQGRDARLLDAFVYATWDIGERVLQVRAGEQVVNWGESTFIQHSISEANPIDITKLRVPGSELREAFIPVQTLWASMDLTDTVSMEAYVQFEWEHVKFDEPGTYFSTADFLGEAGQFIQLGFAQVPENARVARRIGDRDARDSGQYGLKLSWYAENLNETEFGFYFINYHNRRPIISANAIDFCAAGADLTDLSSCAGPTTGLEVTGFLEYLEDIQLYGLSFNTVGPAGLSIGGELSYRVDEPLQIDDVELLFATLEPIGVIPSGTSQIPGTATLGEEISGYRLFDTVQFQTTFTQLFGPMLGASQFTGLMEVGANYIIDMPSSDELRFEAPGTGRSGNPVRDGIGIWGLDATGPCAPVQCEGVEENDFADEFSWGYRLVARLEYLDVMQGINMYPRLVFQHDVSGTTPAPISNFVEGRKALAVGVGFDYLNRWRWDIGYNMFFGGGTANRLSDRDFVAVTLSYSI